jgi:hypothetical protein
MNPGIQRLFLLASKNARALEKDMMKEVIAPNLSVRRPENPLYHFVNLVTRVITSHSVHSRALARVNTFRWYGGTDRSVAVLRCAARPTGCASSSPGPAISGGTRVTLVSGLYLDEAKHSIVPSNHVYLAVFVGRTKILGNDLITQASQKEVCFHLTAAGGIEVIGSSLAETLGNRPRERLQIA